MKKVYSKPEITFKRYNIITDTNAIETKSAATVAQLSSAATLHY